MKNKKSLKGFTLIELIIVMAIFSVLLVGAMRLLSPVTTMFKNASTNEKVYSYTNNIQTYIQGKLEYADNLWVYNDINSYDDAGNITGSRIKDESGNDIDISETQKIAEAFRKTYYDNIVTHVESGDYFSKGTIYVMRLVNSTAEDDANIPRGQITLTAYPFQSDTGISGTSNIIDAYGNSVASDAVQLNPIYFTGRDSKYNFNYAVGASEFEIVDTPAAFDVSGNAIDIPGNVSYRALNTDIDNSKVDMNFTNYANLTISMVAYQRTGANEVPGYVDVSSYRAFKTPSSLSVAPVPLTNISFRYNKAGDRTPNKPISRVFQRTKSDGTKEIASQSVVEAYRNENSFKKFVNEQNTVDLTKDIYFVFAYADEITASGTKVS